MSTPGSLRLRAVEQARLTPERVGGDIRVARVSTTRAGRAVLHDVDATFVSRTCNVVVGPSGAGKTSLLRLLNALDRPTGGTIYLDGTDIQSLAPTELRRRVGMIFQVPVVLPGSVRANLLYELDAPDSAAVSALDEVGLPADLLDRPADELSTGQAQRVCLARALMRSPEVLLLDEPTSALDRDSAAQVERLVVSLAEQGLTIVFVTHDLGQARRLGSNALLLVDGSVRYEGTADRLDEVWSKEVG